MKELYVSLETAKIAKDCGFDLDVFKLYYEWEGGARYVEISKNYDNSEYYDMMMLSYKYPERVVKIPTQSELQKWLREVHKIHVSAYPVFSNRYFYTIRKFYDDKPFEQIVGGARMPEDAKDTYEQALDVGLKEAFVMIK